METYQVTLCFDATIDIDIQAKDEKDAIEKARNHVRLTKITLNLCPKKPRTNP